MFITKIHASLASSRSSRNCTGWKIQSSGWNQRGALGYVVVPVLSTVTGAIVNPRAIADREEGGSGVMTREGCKGSWGGEEFFSFPSSLVLANSSHSCSQSSQPSFVRSQCVLRKACGGGSCCGSVLPLVQSCVSFVSHSLSYITIHKKKGKFLLYKG